MPDHPAYPVLSLGVVAGGWVTLHPRVGAMSRSSKRGHLSPTPPRLYTGDIPYPLTHWRGLVMLEAPPTHPVECPVTLGLKQTVTQTPIPWPWTLRHPYGTRLGQPSALFCAQG